MFYFHVSAQDGIPPPHNPLNAPNPDIPAPDGVGSTVTSQTNTEPSSSSWGFSLTHRGDSPVKSSPSVTSAYQSLSSSSGSSQPAASPPSESTQGGMCLLSVIMSSQFLVPT